MHAVEWLPPACCDGPLSRRNGEVLPQRRFLCKSLRGCNGLHLVQKIWHGHAAVFLAEGIMDIGNYDGTLAVFQIGLAGLHIIVPAVEALVERVRWERNLNRKNPLRAFARGRAQTRNQLLLLIL